MTEQSLTHSSKPRPFLHWMLFFFTFILGIETGGGLFTTIVVFPLWAASAEAVTSWTPDSPFYLEEGNFFMFASPLTFLLSVINLIAGWKSPQPLRKWLMISTIIFILIFMISVAYFIPIQDVVKGEAGTKIPPDKLESMLQVFVWTNYLRQLALVIALGCALHALGISYEKRKAKREE